MASAGWALQRAMYEHLVDAAPLVALIGAGGVFDDVPREARPPYVTFGLTTLADWSTGEAEGVEHVVTLQVWSRENGRREALEIMGVLRDLLHQTALDPDGHRLVDLRHELSEARREPEGDTYRGVIRFRAVTEPLI
ncbi:MAG: DUF3168 domain-containing protein [Hyphomicrobiaceae bacterium]|nr:DUF3168 domain-containing protein [Hyphomicrobiaceae bacterium]